MAAVDAPGEARPKHGTDTGANTVLLEVAGNRSELRFQKNFKETRIDDDFVSGGFDDIE